MNRITILGDGGWGTTLALVLAKKGIGSTIWGAFPDYLDVIRRTRRNPKFLPGFKIPGVVRFSDDIRGSVESADLIILAAPAQYMRSVVRKVPQKSRSKKIWLNVSKGIEGQTLALMSRVIHDELGRVPYAVLSGPTIAREVAAGSPTAVSVASRSPGMRTLLRKLFSSENFTVYEADDVIGLELGGSLKNVIAIAAGIVDALNYGSNTKSVLVARGLAEMARLGIRMGAKRQTFAGLAGLGDLATTCFSVHSRNHACGVRLGRGDSLKQITSSTEMIIEGIDTTRSGFQLAQKHRVLMPIVTAVHNILFKGKNPRSAIEALMHKTLVREND